MTNREKEDLFKIELARGHYYTCQSIIDSYVPRPHEVGDYFIKARMQRQLDGETGMLEDFTSGTDYTLKISKYELLSNE